MRGSLLKAKTKRVLPDGHNTWRVIISLGRASDGRWKQKWVTCRGTKDDAEKKLTELVGEIDRGEFVEPSKRTVGEWLKEWLVKVKTKHCPRTYEVYRNAIQTHLLHSDIATIKLQRLTPERRGALSPLEVGIVECDSPTSSHCIDRRVENCET